MVSVDRPYLPADVDGLMVQDARALVTWAGDEIVTLDSLEPNRGYGTALLAAAEAAMWDQGVRRARLMTSNDNTHALRFYLRRGYRLARIHQDAFNEVFRAKPEAPRTGHDGIALRDLWELQKDLLQP